MNTREIAEKLCDHCKNGTEAQGLKELYAPDATSLEAMGPEGMELETKGVEGIQRKHDWWKSAFEVHDAKVEGPYLNGDNFSVIFEMDTTEKATGNRWKGKEIALYETANGKIVRESFFMMPMS